MRKFCSKRCGTIMCWAAQIVWSQAFAQTPARAMIDSDGTVHLPSFAVPLSRYMSEEAKRKFIEEARQSQSDASDSRPSDPTPSIGRQRADADDYYRPIVERAKARYPVDIEERRIGGVRTQIVVPRQGISPQNRPRLLVNLHGGGFLVGAGLGGLAESIPVAGVGKFKVITVDYRMAPEYHFPAASEDVAAVYAQLLKQYRAENIGIYGCSAGGILSAMAAAWLQKVKLPLPGALGIFSAGAFGHFSGPPEGANTWGGDSYFMTPLLGGEAPLPLTGPPPGAPSGAMNYVEGTDPQDPLVSPALSTSILAKFPPTLLITGTRAPDMSAAVQTQRVLTRSGTVADLHLWDGMGHCFIFDVDIPESREAFAVIAHFFDHHLGRHPK